MFVKNRRPETIWGTFWISAWVLSLIFWLSCPTASLLQRGKPVLVLLFGTDQAHDSEHSDTLLLVSFDPKRNGLDFLSIPRDTKVNMPGYRFHRINEVFGYQLRKSGRVKIASQVLLEAVESILSTDTVHVKIPFYVHVDYSGFRRIVDLAGGVWVTVPEPMDYDDLSGGYHFHAKPGKYHFMGDQALAYVRFRGQSGDKGRILRQHGFIRALFKRALNPYMTFRFPLLLSAAWQGLHTNMGFSDMVCLALEMRALQPGHIGFKLLPGTTSGPYWVMDREAAWFAIQQFTGEVPHDSRMLETIRPLQDTITVKVWNASLEPGMARRVAFALRQAGFDVVGWGNFDTRAHSTRIIDRGGDLEAARKVAQFLETEDVHSEVNRSLLVDVEVIVGDDYKGPGSEPASSWNTLSVNR